MKPHRMRAHAAAALLPAALVLLAACTRSTQAQQGPPPAVPIRAGMAEKRDVPVEIRAIGSVEAYSTVEIKAQVNGIIETIGFREGQDVRRGDLLFTIDPRPFRAALDSAQAQLSRDQVQLRLAQQDVERYRDLVAKDYVTKEEYDRIQTNEAALLASIRADEAAVEYANLQLEYCTIRSPIDGRTGALMVHAGNLVKANGDNAMVVINQTSPVYVSFAVPERHLDDIRAEMAARPLEVRATVSEAADSVVGSLRFVDNAVDRRTGTVLLKGQFANESKLLWPGRFVDTTLRLSTRAGAVLVPTQAVQTGQQGQFVWVVKADNTVESRDVEAGMVVGSDTVIEKGLEAGEKVVTDGQLRLSPGAAVEIKT